MSSELGGGAGLCQNPSHMQPRGLWGCEAAPPRAGPRNEARPSWRKGSLHHPSTGPTLAVWFSGGGGSNEAVGRDWGLWIFVLDSVSHDCNISSSSDSAIGPPPRAALGKVLAGTIPLCLPVEDPQKAQRFPFGLGWGVWHWSRFAQLCLSVSPFCLSLSLATTGDTREFQMTNFLRDLG